MVQISANVSTRTSFRIFTKMVNILVIGNKITVRRLFLLGQSDQKVPENSRRESLLREEAREWGDILQGDFQDSFRNLTLKEIMFLRWLPHYCPHTKFIFKVRFLTKKIFDFSNLMPFFRMFQTSVQNLTSYM